MDGLAPVLRCLLAMGAIPWSEKLGVRPRPMCLNGVLLLRLFSKPMAMGLLLIWVMLSLFLNPGVPDNGGGGRRRRRPWTAGTKASQNFVVIFFFCRDFCANWLGQLSSCILLEGACICSVLVYGFLV